MRNKSGYGLDLENELKQLRVMRECSVIHPVDLVPTFLDAHAIPPKFQDRKQDYVEGGNLYDGCS